MSANERRPYTFARTMRRMSLSVSISIRSPSRHPQVDATILLFKDIGVYGWQGEKLGGRGSFQIRISKTCFGGGDRRFKE